MSHCRCESPSQLEQRVASGRCGCVLPRHHSKKKSLAQFGMQRAIAYRLPRSAYLCRKPHQPLAKAHGRTLERAVLVRSNHFLRVKNQGQMQDDSHERMGRTSTVRVKTAGNSAFIEDMRRRDVL